MKQRLLTLAVLMLALGMIAVGLTRGENAPVAKKAEMVCLECIGIG